MPCPREPEGPQGLGTSKSFTRPVRCQAGSGDQGPAVEGRRREQRPALAEVYVAASHDQGDTWTIDKITSGNFRSNQDQRVDYFMGELSAAPNGRLDSSFWDRSYPGNQLEDLAYATSSDGGLT
jgi:hypothetical protein